MVRHGAWPARKSRVCRSRQNLVSQRHATTAVSSAGASFVTWRILPSLARWRRVVALTFVRTLHFCSLVITEVAAGMVPMLANSLGVGAACSMPDADTTDAQVEEFDRGSFIKIYGRARKAA